MSTSPDDLFAEAVRLHRANDLPAAEAAYRTLLDVVPVHPAALCNLGAVRVKLGDEAEAVKLYYLALLHAPDFPDALFNLGNVHRRAGDLIAAAELFARCVQTNPDHAPAQFNLGVTTAALGRPVEAEAAFRRAIELEPGTAGRAHLRLGDVLNRLGRSADAVPYLRAYADATPNDPAGPFHLALALAGSGKAADAADVLQRLLRWRPEDADAHNALGLAQAALGRQDDAIHHFEKAVSIKPTLAEGWSNLAVSLSEQGRTDDAIAAFRKAVDANPDVPLIHGNLLLNLNYSSRLTPEQVRDDLFAWADKFAPAVPPPTPRPPLDPARRLRIGYLSSDYRAHSSAGLLRAVLEHHDREQFEVFAYSTVHRPDATTDELKVLADRWATLTGTPPTLAAERIRTDGVDVLLEVGGHGGGTNLLVMAGRPAAVQGSLGGMPTTTGMAVMDFRVSDAESDPPGMTEHLYREKLVRLPVPWIYTPPHDAPAVGPLPALGRRQFTLGCLNNSSKVSETAVTAWVNLLANVAGTRLVLAGGQSATGQKRLTDRFIKAGVLRDRVQVLSRLPREQYLAKYAEFDLALDPFPYTGGTTTADALWMGVPVLTVAGASAVSRQGAMQMRAVGLGEFVLESVNELHAAVKSWMGRREELAGIRAGLRERLAGSAVCDAVGFVRGLEEAVRAEWVRAGEPAT